MGILSNIIKSEKGLSIIESLMITATIAAVIFVVGPSLRQAFVGTPNHAGIGTRIVQQQTAGVDESSKNVKVLEGCQLVGNITSEKCSELDN